MFCNHLANLLGVQRCAKGSKHNEQTMCDPRTHRALRVGREAALLRIEGRLSLAEVQDILLGLPPTTHNAYLTEISDY